MPDLTNYRARPDLLKGRVILVTGASRGIGRVAALTFAAHGATVVLHGRDMAALENVYDQIETNGYAQPAAIPFDLDKATTRDYDALAYAIESQLGRLDGILHNAAHVEKLSPLEQQSAGVTPGLVRVSVGLEHIDDITEDIAQALEAVRLLAVAAD